MKRIASTAIVQIAAQAAMLQRFGEITGQKLTPNQVLFDGVVIQLDGYCETEDRVILAECWAHIGKAKVAQKHKIAADILKLSLAAFEIRKLHPRKTIECYLIFADEDASRRTLLIMDECSGSSLFSNSICRAPGRRNYRKNQRSTKGPGLAGASTH